MRMGFTNQIIGNQARGICKAMIAKRFARGDEEVTIARAATARCDRARKANWKILNCRCRALSIRRAMSHLDAVVDIVEQPGFSIGQAPLWAK